MRAIRHLIQLVATGLVGSALVAAPASAAPTWQPITTLFADLSADGGSAQTPAVAVDAAGNATAIWSRWDGTQLVVQASTRTAGGTWNAPVDLAAGRSIYNPQLAVDPAGNATAIWRRREVSSSVVQATTRPAGGTWSAPVDLSVNTTDDPSQRTDFPQVAVDAAGVVTATWSRSEAFRHTVQGATRLTDGTWTTPVDLSAPGRSARTSEVAVDTAGNATAIWVSGALIQAATRPTGGAWSAPVDLSSVAGSDATPRIVVDPTGTASAIWGSFTTTYGIQTASRPADGTWTTPVDLSAPGEDTFPTPQIAVGPQGTVTALWQRQDRGWVVTAATRDSNGTWNTPVDLSTLGRNAWDPQITIDPQGTATAIWSDADVESAGRRTVQAVNRTDGGEWSAPVDLSVSGGDAWNPQIAVDPAGNVTSTWSRHDGTNWIVQARGLDVAGPVVTALTAGSAARTPGTPARMQTWSVKAYDVWSSVRTARWIFPDGTTATGTSVTHAVGTDSTRPVRVTLTDAVGNATACTYTGTYRCRATTRVAPLVTRATLTQHKIRAEGSRSKAAAKTKARLVLTTAAKVTLVFRKSGATKSVKLIKRVKAGKSILVIRARLAPKKVLLPGRYTIRLTAKNRFGTSPKTRLRLRVVR